MTALGIIAIIFCGILCFLLCYIGFMLDKHSWNRGRCGCGNNWKLFDHDSQGGRGYKCDGCEHYLWVSWPVDKTKNKVASK